MHAEKSLSCPGPCEQILACTDGSDAGQNAVAQGLSLAQACGCKLVVLQVVEIIPEYEAVAPDLRACLEEEIHRQKSEVCSRAALKGVQLGYHIIHSVSPFAAIVEEAGKLLPDLVIIGRYGRPPLVRLFMGSVTARVIGLSPVNVIVVPRNADLAFRRLLVAADGSEFSRAAVAEAIAMARHAGAELFGVAVAREEGEILEAQEIVNVMLKSANEAGVSFQGFSPQGMAADEGIIRVAQEKQVDLIIMGSHGRTGLKRLLMGSVTERVIGRATCPVLVVKKR